MHGPAPVKAVSIFRAMALGLPASTVTGPFWRLGRSIQAGPDASRAGDQKIARVYSLGQGGQLPAKKVTVEIAAARGGIVPGVELVLRRSIMIPIRRRFGAAYP